MRVKQAKNLTAAKKATYVRNLATKFAITQQISIT